MYVREAKLGSIHWPLVACVLVLAGLGVWNLGSAGRHEAGTVWLQQLRFLGLGFVLAGLSLALFAPGWSVECGSAAQCDTDAEAAAADEQFWAALGVRALFRPS